VEEETVFGRPQHRGVVVRVAGRDDAVVEGLEGLDRATLLVVEAQLVVDDAIVLHDEAVTYEGRHAEMAHQRPAELFECVGQNDHLGDRSQLVEEFSGAVEGGESRNHLF